MIEKKKISKDFCSKLGKMLLQSQCVSIKSSFHYFCCKFRYQKDKYLEIASHFSPFSRAHYPFIWPWKTASAQSTLRPSSLPFPNINNTSSSSSFSQIIPFNNETRGAFGLMLEGSRASNRERLSIAERQQILDWISETRPRKTLTDKEAKRKS